ncbi:hypothetical protein NXX40_19135 [Parabacteroides distasonis]|nr:hypothetical protein [Parabacteroides distasonis]
MVLSSFFTSIFLIPVYRTAPSGRFFVVEQEVSKKASSPSSASDDRIALWVDTPPSPWGKYPSLLWEGMFPCSGKACFPALGGHPS